MTPMGMLQQSGAAVNKSVDLNAAKKDTQANETTTLVQSQADKALLSKYKRNVGITKTVPIKLGLDAVNPMTLNENENA